MTSAEGTATVDLSQAKSTVKSHLLYYGAMSGCLIVDQLTKAWVVDALPLYQPVDVFHWLAPILSFTHVENTGVAFGIFPSLGGLFAVLSLLVVGAILVFRRTLMSEGLWLHGALGLVTGGALGNLIDRIVRGHVVDYIDVNFWPFGAWPVFNIADSAVVVGVIILLVDSILVEGEGVAARV